MRRAVPGTVQRAALIGELEPHGRQELSLWVAKQHGHSVQTMLEVYAGWTGGASEADIEAIRQAMNATGRAHVRAASATAAASSGRGICHQNATSEVASGS